MKIIEVYKSATGFTKKYARWIAEELSADLFDIKSADLSKLMGYDCIIFGGRLHAVGIDGVRLITGHFEQLKEKRILIFATGASLPSEEITDQIIQHNFTEDQRSLIEFYYFRGGFDFKSLPLGDKVLMTLLRKKILRKKARGVELGDDEAGMLSLYEDVSDFTSKESIHPILRSVSDPLRSDRDQNLH